MGYRCDQCGHEWIPRNVQKQPSICPICKSPNWNQPRKAMPMLTYEDFRDKVQKALQSGPLTWTEIRTDAALPQKLPNNQWVHRLEKDIGLKRERDAHGIIHWQLK
jgi:hypothetical protein